MTLVESQGKRYLSYTLIKLWNRFAMTIRVKSILYIFILMNTQVIKEKSECKYASVWEVFYFPQSSQAHIWKKKFLSVPAGAIRSWIRNHEPLLLQNVWHSLPVANTSGSCKWWIVKHKTSSQGSIIKSSHILVCLPSYSVLPQVI